jgi:hypothetical protein
VWRIGSGPALTAPNEIGVLEKPGKTTPQGESALETSNSAPRLLATYGCAVLSQEAGLQGEAALKKAYADCLARSGKDESNCATEKDRLLEQKEWKAMDGGV